MESAPRKEMGGLEEVVDSFINNKNTNEVIDYLKNHKDDIGEFCLSVKDSYSEKDVTTSYLRLAELIKELL